MKRPNSLGKLRPRASFSGKSLLAFILAFGSIIGYLIFHTFAAPNPSLPGDLDGNNKVDSADLAIMIVNYGTTFSGADITGDGIVNGADFAQLLTNYGESYTASGVPVPSNIAADCSVDVTAQLTSWINSVPDGSTLLFGQGKCYRVEGTIEIQGRSNLTFEGNGAAFKSLNPMTDGVYADDQRAMFRAIDSANLVYRDMNITGAFNFTGKIDESLQHAHAIDLRGTSAEINNVNASNIGGDCVYFGLGYSSAQNKSSGSYYDSTCSRISRNAVSVVAGQNITVQRVGVDSIGYDAFDVEPNQGGGNGAANVVFDDNTIGSYYLSAYSIVENAPITAQSFTNNHITGPKGFKVTIGDPSSAGFRPSHVTITGNVADKATAPTPLNADNIDYLTATGNTVTMTSAGYFAAVDGGCQLNVSSNTLQPAGSLQLYSINPVTGC
jgi:hypothetical protein